MSTSLVDHCCFSLNFLLIAWFFEGLFCFFIHFEARKLAEHNKVHVKAGLVLILFTPGPFSFFVTFISVYMNYVLLLYIGLVWN